MTRITRHGAAAALLAIGLGCSSAAPAVPAQPPAAATRDTARRVDRTTLMRDLRTLADPALEGRRTGTPGNRKARDFILRRFEAIGLTPAGADGYLQPFTFTPEPDAEADGGAGPGASAEGVNVVGRIDGATPDARWIVITAHYDHLGVKNGRVYPGADDNASGVAALLAAARYVADHRPQHTMVFAALDAEEQGLQGGRALVRSIPDIATRVALNINLDMVSRSDRKEIYAAGTHHYPWTRPILEDIRKRSRVRILFGHDQPKADSGLDDWTMLSDHGAFHEAGVPFVYFGVEDHPDYHEPTDTAGRIDPAFFGDAVEMIVEAIRTFDVELARSPAAHAR